MKMAFRWQSILLDVHGDDKLDDTRFTRLKHLVFSKLRHVHLVELRQLIQSQPVIPQVGLGGTLVGDGDGILRFKTKV